MAHTTNNVTEESAPTAYAGVGQAGPEIDLSGAPVRGPEQGREGGGEEVNEEKEDEWHTGMHEDWGEEDGAEDEDEWDLHDDEEVLAYYDMYTKRDVTTFPVANSCLVKQTSQAAFTAVPNGIEPPFKLMDGIRPQREWNRTNQEPGWGKAMSSQEVRAPKRAPNCVSAADDDTTPRIVTTTSSSNPLRLPQDFDRMSSGGIGALSISLRVGSVRRSDQVNYRRTRSTMSGVSLKSGQAVVKCIWGFPNLFYGARATSSKSSECIESISWGPSCAISKLSSVCAREDVEATENAH
ncbi:hypothetical protein BKA70DRAFT_1214809 [Coprinopsis sp. MPI-PUGE-AT-0042]|nr:hypothetical protein BKA70DRAFT_1214809 [Coprinopsis sp. MPI-PUGE-AT-0042]